MKLTVPQAALKVIECFDKANQLGQIYYSQPGGKALAESVDDLRKALLEYAQRA